MEEKKSKLGMRMDCVYVEGVVDSPLHGTKCKAITVMTKKGEPLISAVYPLDHDC